MRNYVFAIGVSSLLLSLPANAQDKYAVHPVRLADESIRFYKGVPTIDIDGKDGAVQVSPLAMDHGSFSFSVAVLNKGSGSADFDVTDVTADAGGTQLICFTKDELEKRAKNRAMWTAIAVGLAGGLASAAAASQRDHYSATMFTPRGTYRAFYSAPSVAGQLQATAIAAGTGYSIARIQDNLDATREALGNNIVQRTTVDPGEGYGGQVIFQKVKLKTFPQQMVIVVKWNGEDYRFGFVVGKKGMKAPAIAPLKQPPEITEASPNIEQPGDGKHTTSDKESLVDPVP